MHTTFKDLRITLDIAKMATLAAKMTTISNEHESEIPGLVLQRYVVRACLELNIVIVYKCHSFKMG